MNIVAAKKRSKNSEPCSFQASGADNPCVALYAPTAPRRRGVVRVVARDGVEDPRCIFDRTGDRPGHILSEGERNDAGAAHEPPCWSDADEVICGRGGADGVDGIGADTCDAKIRRHRGTGTSAGASRCSREIIRVERLSLKRASRDS